MRYGIESLEPKQVFNATLTLTIDEAIEGVDTFAFDIIVSASDKTSQKIDDPESPSFLSTQIDKEMYIYLRVRVTTVFTSKFTFETT